MKVLYVVASCLTKNTSANMSHNGYVQGLLENGCDVDILMAEDSWGAQDSAMPVWKNANYYSFTSISKIDRMRFKMRGKSIINSSNSLSGDEGNKQRTTTSMSIKAKVRKFLKWSFYKIFPADPLYPLEKNWLKNATKFSSDCEYDIVISNSSPAAGHKLVNILLRHNRIRCKRWIQIWEDPWYADLYNVRDPKIFDEEHSLLRTADEIYYVSPLTLKYQKELFPDCAKQMMHIPLPYLNFAKDDRTTETKLDFGYFGDYYSNTRNLKPFYEALSATNYTGSIYGDSDLSLQSTERIHVNGRVTLDVLEKVQRNTCVLVHLCNLRGGQIPGKIYHYSATNKPILFILDGTEEECEILFKYFSQFNRFYFCQNNKDEIIDMINKICEEKHNWEPVPDFAPKNVIHGLL